MRGGGRCPAARSRPLADRRDRCRPLLDPGPGSERGAARLRSAAPASSSAARASSSPRRTGRSSACEAWGGTGMPSPLRALVPAGRGTGTGGCASRHGSEGHRSLPRAVVGTWRRTAARVGACLGRGGRRRSAGRLVVRAATRAFAMACRRPSPAPGRTGRAARRGRARAAAAGRGGAAPLGAPWQRRRPLPRRPFQGRRPGPRRPPRACRMCRGIRPLPPAPRRSQRLAARDRRLRGGRRVGNLQPALSPRDL